MNVLKNNLAKNDQFDIFHTKMLQNTSRCHVTASIWILCNILENIPHALDVHAQRVLKYTIFLGSLKLPGFKYIILK
jgi:hypothetical protein